MANALYDLGRQGFLAGDIDWDGASICVALVSANSTASAVTTAQFYSDIDNVIIASHSSGDNDLQGKSVTNGVADATDFQFSSVTSGSTVDAIVLYQWDGVTTTSELIAYIDTETGSSPISLPTNDGAITIAWDDGANKIFKL